MTEEFSFILLACPVEVTGIFSMKVYRGEFTCPKKGSLKLNVLIVGNLPQCLLIPQKGSQFTVKHVS